MDSDWKALIDEWAIKNISDGGTGKTAQIEDFIEFLEERNFVEVIRKEYLHGLTNLTHEFCKKI